MTLLVLGLALPVGFHASQVVQVPETLQTAFPVYVLSFTVIRLYWRAHLQVFQHIEACDRTLLTLNVVFLLSIAVVPFSTNLLSNAATEPVAVAA